MMVCDGSKHDERPDSARRRSIVTAAWRRNIIAIANTIAAQRHQGHSGVDADRADDRSIERRRRAGPDGICQDRGHRKDLHYHPKRGNRRHQHPRADQFRKVAPLSGTHQDGDRGQSERRGRSRERVHRRAVEQKHRRRETNQQDQQQEWNEHGGASERVRRQPTFIGLSDHGRQVPLRDRRRRGAAPADFGAVARDLVAPAAANRYHAEWRINPG